MPATKHTELVKFDWQIALRPRHQDLCSKLKHNLQVFNEINSRKLKDELNIFAGLWHSRTFVYIIIVTIGLQVRSP